VQMIDDSGQSVTRPKKKNLSDINLDFPLIKRLRLNGSTNDRHFFCLTESSIPIALSGILSFNRRQRYDRNGEQFEKSIVHHLEDLAPIQFEDDKEISYEHLLSTLSTLDDGQSRSSKSLRRPVSVDQADKASKKTSNAESWRASSWEPQIINNELEKPIETVQDNDMADCFDFESAFLRTAMRFPGSSISVVNFMNKTESKKELNERFHQRFPHVGITFSKFQSIRMEMEQIGRECQIDWIALTHAFVFYEQVLLKGLVNKSNRKLVAGAALLLAVKVNDVNSGQLNLIISRIEAVFRIGRRDLLRYEVPLSVALDFRLNLTDEQLRPHYRRLLLAQR